MSSSTVQSIVMNDKKLFQVDSKSPYGPKGKCPWITINGEDIGDSEFVLDNLTQRFNVNLESHLTTKQVANLEAVRVLADEHFFWCVLPIFNCTILFGLDNGGSNFRMNYAVQITSIVLYCLESNYEES